VQGRFLRGIVAAVACAVGVLAAGVSTASAGTLPSGFQETTAFSGLTNPMVVKFAPDGKVFVAEKSGLIKVYDGLGDSTPTVWADLRTKVHNFWDRGMLGMTLDINYAAGYPWLYVLYTHDAAIGGTAPRWGSAGATSDGCPTPPGPTGDGCVVSGRLSRLTPEPGGTVDEEVLIEDWCQQYPSHSVGSVEYDPWGGLYASAGDGASFNFADWGQDGSPVNPCGDPGGSSPTPPNAQGGALRSQDQRARGDATGLDGSVIRVDPNDGSPIWFNPGASDPEANVQRQLAYGLRNPFRFTIDRDGELWIGDVGWNDWEEINRLNAGSVTNFGWPCYEGNGRQPGYDSADLSLCETLYGTAGAATPPYYAYNHAAKVVAGETCPTGSSSIAGLQFNYDSAFPAAYKDALFFTDYSRDCIWVMRAGANGQPDPSTISTFDAGAANPVNLQFGPDGALYYPDFDGGRIQRIQYSASNQQPTAAIDASPRSGPPPLAVSLDGRRSADPDGDQLTYAWDLDDDGQFDDASSATTNRTFSTSGSYRVGLRVTDGRGGSATATTTIDVGNSPPTPTITSPTPALRWQVGQRIGFSGSAADPEQGALPASALRWELLLNHCPSNCHTHPVQTFTGSSGSFVAPDHEYPSHLELRLTATDAAGLSSSTSVRIDPSTVDLTLTTNQSTSAGLSLTLNGAGGLAPLRRTLIKGSQNSISAPTPQTIGRYRYTYRSWSDGGSRTHNVTVSSSRTIRANYDRTRTSGNGRRRGGRNR
jgi:glucose/arabinose dehydrogenase